ncbi:hypothetical protein CPB86DRAFT_694370 [Serendipita vermifera]|nr:hypothetical protein CPB86DRAFT_694370 [Serendipita vermifera]
MDPIQSQIINRLDQTPSKDKDTLVYDQSTLPSKFVRHPPARKLSLEWMGMQWDSAVKVGRWPRIIYATIGLLLLSVWVGITRVFLYQVFFAKEEVKYQKDNIRPGVAATNFAGNDQFGMLVLEGSLKSFDIPRRTLTIQWSAKMSFNGTNQELGGEYAYEIGIYKDYKLVQDTRVNRSDPVNDGYLYSVDNVTAPAIAVVGLHPWDNFNTDIDLGQAKAQSPWRQPLFGFPFDRWSGNLILVANFRDLARQYNLTNSFGLPIYSVWIVDSLINWRIRETHEDTCLKGEALSPYYDDVAECQMTINFIAKRPGMVITATIIAVVVNWLSTIFIFVMTCEGVIMRRIRVIEEAQLLAVCFTALFALPSVRAILPGAPEFGALNLVGIVPNVIIISLCTTLVAIQTLRRIAKGPVLRTSKGEDIPNNCMSPFTPRVSSLGNLDYSRTGLTALVQV